MNTRFNNEERQKIVEAYFQSGKTQTEFAPEYGVKPGTLSNWVTKYKMAAFESTSDVHFVEVKSTVLSHSQNLKIRKNGMEIELPLGCPVSLLKETLTIISAL